LVCDIAARTAASTTAICSAGNRNVATIPPSSSTRVCNDRSANCFAACERVTFRA
jgi:hypothetical protein